MKLITDLSCLYAVRIGFNGLLEWVYFYEPSEYTISWTFTFVLIFRDYGSIRSDVSDVTKHFVLSIGSSLSLYIIITLSIDEQNDQWEDSSRIAVSVVPLCWWLTPIDLFYLDLLSLSINLLCAILMNSNLYLNESCGKLSNVLNVTTINVNYTINFFQS